MDNKSDEIVEAGFVSMDINEAFNVQGGVDNILINSVKQSIFTFFIFTK